VAVEGAGADATIAGGLFYGSLVGLAVYDGTVSLEDDGVLRVTAMLDGVGILVGKAGAGTAAVSVMNPNLQFNSVGLGLVAGSATVSGGDISYNGLTPGPVTAGGIVASGGTLLVSNQTRLSNNLVGLVVDGASAAVSSATFQANNTQGVVVNSTPADGSAQLQSVTISGGTQGVAIKGGTVIIDSADIGGASADGVTIEGKQDLASATFTRLKVHDNKAAGISASGGAKGANLHLSSSEIYANYAGGFSVTSALELAGFQGNKLHGNGNAQIIFSAAPPASAWDIKSSCLDASIENEVYCYPTGAVGVRLDMKTAPSKTVSAKAIGWANAAPAQDVDFAGPAGSIDVSGQCSAVPCP
jgi:hypothetical protein